MTPLDPVVLMYTIELSAESERSSLWSSSSNLFFNRFKMANKFFSTLDEQWFFEPIRSLLWSVQLRSIDLIYYFLHCWNKSEIYLTINSIYCNYSIIGKVKLKKHFCNSSLRKIRILKLIFFSGLRIKINLPGPS